MIQKTLRKIFQAAVLAFALCLFASGCAPSPVSEKDLLSYVSQDDPMADHMPLYGDPQVKIQYHDLKMDKRLTDKDAKSDQIWVHFSADTTTDAANVEARMNFTLYNDGWLLDNTEIISIDYSPLAGPERDGAAAQLMTHYDYYQLQREEIDLENKTAGFYYKTLNEYKYADFGYVVRVNYHYNNSRWFCDGIDIVDEMQDWRRIFGEWSRFIDHTNNRYIRTTAISTSYILSIEDFDGSILHGSYDIQYLDSRYDDEFYSDSGYFTGALEGIHELTWYLDAEDIYFMLHSKAGVVLRNHDRPSGAYQSSEVITQTEAPYASTRLFDDFFEKGVEVEMGEREQ